MQWMAIWMHPYAHQSHGGGLILLKLGNNWVQTIHYDMGEANNPFRLENISILYI